MGREQILQLQIVGLEELVEVRPRRFIQARVRFASVYMFRWFRVKCVVPNSYKVLCRPEYPERVYEEFFREPDLYSLRWDHLEDARELRVIHGAKESALDQKIRPIFSHDGTVEENKIIGGAILDPLAERMIIQHGILRVGMDYNRTCI